MFPFAVLARLLWRPLALRFGPQFELHNSIEISRLQARTVLLVDFLTSPARRRRGRACDGCDWSTLHFPLDCLLDCGHFDRLAFWPLRRALGFDGGSLDGRNLGGRSFCRRNQQIAATHAFLRCDVGGTRAVGHRTRRGISLKTYQIFRAFGAAVPYRAGEVLET